jgi:hypothetical protein
MTLSPRTLPWIIAGVLMLLIALLAFGFWRGELALTNAGGLVRLQRSANPAGFYVLAGVYAALAAGCAWLLVAVLNAPDRGGPGSPPPAHPAGPERRASMQSADNLQISQDGRGGQILLTLVSGSHSFWWEFGGGDCIACINVPDPTHWLRIPALAAHPREHLLQWLAEEVARRQCPNARILVGDLWIEFRQG